MEKEEEVEKLCAAEVLQGHGGGVWLCMAKAVCGDHVAY